MMKATQMSVLAGLVLTLFGIASAATVYNPFVLKSENDPKIQLIGGDLVNNAYLRRGNLEQDLYVVLDEAERQRKATGRVKDITKRRIVSLKQGIAVLNDKIEKYKRVLNQQD